MGYPRDSNHTASCQVAFRKVGQGRWHKRSICCGLTTTATTLRHGQTAPTTCWRVVFFFLKPGTRYEVRLRLQDADGGGAERQFAVDTWAPRAIVPGGRRYHVIPGDGGGVGTRDDPIWRADPRGSAGPTGGPISAPRGATTGSFLPTRRGRPVTASPTRRPETASSTCTI